jgi:hypothetical protein
VRADELLTSGRSRRVTPGRDYQFAIDADDGGHSVCRGLNGRSSRR